MPTTPPLQCCDTRARARTASRKGWGRGREGELHGEWKEDTEEEEGGAKIKMGFKMAEISSQQHNYRVCSHLNLWTKLQ